MKKIETSKCTKWHKNKLYKTKNYSLVNFVLSIICLIIILVSVFKFPHCKSTQITQFGMFWILTRLSDLWHNLLQANDIIELETQINSPIWLPPLYSPLPALLCVAATMNSCSCSGRLNGKFVRDWQKDCQSGVALRTPQRVNGIVKCAISK